MRMVNAQPTCSMRNCAMKLPNCPPRKDLSVPKAKRPRVMETHARVMMVANVVSPSGSGDLRETSRIPYNNIRKGKPTEATPKKNWMKK